MQAIETKYIGPTNYRGSRIKAQCERGSITVSYDDSLNSEQAHIAAATALVQKFMREDHETYGSQPMDNPWGKPRAVGGTKKGYVHVFIENGGK